jgi:hypothetical protein
VHHRALSSFVSRCLRSRGRYLGDIAYALPRINSAPDAITAAVSSAHVDGGGAKRAPGPIGDGVFDDAFSSEDDVVRAAMRDAKEPMAILIQCVKAFVGNMSFASWSEALDVERALLPSGATQF